MENENIKNDNNDINELVDRAMILIKPIKMKNLKMKLLKILK